MEDLNSSGDGLYENSDGEEFRSCCEEDEGWQDTEDSASEGSEEDFDEFSVKLFFKGVSMSQVENSSSGASGIGVIMERPPRVSILQVQKKLDFYVEESVADHLALMDGLLEALRCGIRRVFAFTDSGIVYDQISQVETPENPLLIALGQRILEHADRLETFELKLVCRSELQRSLQLAQEAVGIFSRDGLLVDCPICCEERQSSQMITMHCSHKFCSQCMIKYVEGKLQMLQVPMKCPQLRCRYYISTSEFKSFLPVTCYESLERALIEAGLHNSERVHCPFPNCSVLLSPRHFVTTRASSSSRSDTGRVECPECHRLVCIDCSAPWHSSMSCEEYQNIPAEERDTERDTGDITLHRLAQNNNWRRCQQCRRMIELTQGCYHMTCWCGHEFCYSCGAGYRNGQQTCQCAYWDGEEIEPSAVEPPNQELEPWRWESFSLPPTIDAYSEQERSQLALIQRFLAGGFGSLSDQNPYHSPPHCSDSSYLDTIKDLHQLPWLERFVSVISDNYHEDYIQ